MIINNHPHRGNNRTPVSSRHNTSINPTTHANQDQTNNHRGVGQRRTTDHHQIPQHRVHTHFTRTDTNLRACFHTRYETDRRSFEDNSRARAREFPFL